MVLITGATSGIGKAVAEAFAKDGKKLILVARRKERLDGLSQELSKLTEVKTFVLDISIKEAVTKFQRENAALLANVEILVNNAGLAKGLDNIQTGDIEDWEKMIDTNVKGLLYLTRALLEPMTQKKRGHIINIGSVAGHWVYPKGNIYCATKHAVNALNQAMRIDLVGLGIRVTEISPGMVETEFSEVRLGDKERAKAVYKGMTPLKAEDIADAVVWSAKRPAHVNIQEIILYPTDQAAPTIVNRT